VDPIIYQKALTRRTGIRSTFVLHCHTLQSAPLTRLLVRQLGSVPLTYKMCHLPHTLFCTGVKFCLGILTHKAHSPQFTHYTFCPSFITLWKRAPIESANTQVEHAFERDLNSTNTKICVHIYHHARLPLFRATLQEMVPGAKSERDSRPRNSMDPAATKLT
jgi:hypothetical protein